MTIKPNNTTATTAVTSKAKTIRRVPKSGVDSVPRGTTEAPLGAAHPVAPKVEAATGTPTSAARSALANFKARKGNGNVSTATMDGTAVAPDVTNGIPPTANGENPNGSVENDQGTNTTVEAPEGASELWREFLTERQKTDYAGVEAKIKSEQEQVNALREKIARQQALLAEADSDGLKKSLQSEIKKGEKKAEALETTITNRTKALTSIQEAGQRKADARTAKDAKRTVQNAEAKANNALAKRDKYDITPLTPEQLERLGELVTEGKGHISAIKTGFINFYKVVDTIYKEGLHHNRKGGLKELVMAEFEIDSTYFYRNLIAGEQYTAMANLLSQKVVALDNGKDVNEISPDELPQTEGALRELRKFGTAENQLKVWQKALAEAKGSGKSEPSMPLIRRVGDQMVANDEIAIGLDAEIKKNAEARKQKEGRRYPLNFNRYMSEATSNGHVFQIWSVRDSTGSAESRIYHMVIDGAEVKNDAGKVFTTRDLDVVTRMIEERARTIISGEMADADEGSAAPTTPAGETHAEPKAKSKGKATAPQAAPAPPVNSGGTKYFIGYDGEKGQVFDHKGDDEPGDDTGYDYHVGPFDSQKSAVDYLAAEIKKRQAEQAAA